MKKNTKMMIGALVVVTVIGYLFISGFSGNMGQQVTLTQLTADPQKYDGEFIQTEGNLVEESVKWDPIKVELRFDIYEGDKKVSVLWKDVKPDNFQQDVIVTVTGTYKPGQAFEAETLTTKCPSKYESADGQVPEGYKIPEGSKLKK